MLKKVLVVLLVVFAVSSTPFVNAAEGEFKIGISIGTLKQ